MLSVELDEQNHIAPLEPDGPLSQSDFESATRVLDSYIAQTGGLKGIVIHALILQAGSRLQH